MLTAIAQLVEISTLKTSASLPIQIRIRRSTSGQAVRLRKAMASPSQTSAVDRRWWRALAKYVIRAPMVRVMVIPFRYEADSTALSSDSELRKTLPHFGPVRASAMTRPLFEPPSIAWSVQAPTKHVLTINLDRQGATYRRRCWPAPNLHFESLSARIPS